MDRRYVSAPDADDKMQRLAANYNLFTAIAAGDMDGVKNYAPQADLNFTFGGNTCLHQAVGMLNPACVVYLLEQKADHTAVNADNETPLQHALSIRGASNLKGNDLTQIIVSLRKAAGVQDAEVKADAVFHKLRETLAIVGYKAGLIRPAAGQ